MIKFFKTPRFFQWIYPKRTWGFSLKSNTLFLTFDDGPDPEITPWILDYLKTKNIKATFFCVGQNILDEPEIFQRIISEGHHVGNHTFNHAKFTKVKRKVYLSSIAQSNEIHATTLFRPPYGRLGMLTSKKLSKSYKIIMWSWLSYDYDKNVDLQTILKEADKIKSGDILVLHDNKKVKDRIQLLLPELIEKLLAKGFHFESIAY